MVELPVLWILRFVIVDLIIFFICTFSLQKKKFWFLYHLFFFFTNLLYKVKKMDFSLCLYCKYCKERQLLSFFLPLFLNIFLKKYKNSQKMYFLCNLLFYNFQPFLLSFSYWWIFFIIKKKKKNQRKKIIKKDEGWNDNHAMKEGSK